MLLRLSKNALLLENLTRSRQHIFEESEQHKSRKFLFQSENNKCYMLLKLSKNALLLENLHTPVNTFFSIFKNLSDKGWNEK